MTIEVAKLWEQARKLDDRIFLIDSVTDRSFTYAEFLRLTGWLGAALRERGMERGSRLAILMANAPEYVALYFACLFNGIVAMPINPQLSKDDIRFILDHCGAAWVAADQKSKEWAQAEALPQPIMQLQPGADWSIADARPGEGPLPVFDGVTPDGLAAVHFTSGTTGQPKGVVHRLGSLLGSAADFNAALGFERETRMFHVFQMAYMAGYLNTLLCPFLVGGSVVAGAAFDPMLALNFWNAPKKHGVNTLWLAPSIAASLTRLNRDQDGLRYCQRHIRTICVGTAPLTPRIKREFEEKYQVELHESYGLSETLFNATQSPRYPRHEGSVGKPIGPVEIRAGAEHAADPDASGELLIRTPYLMAGYLNYETGEPEPVAPSDWFATGDIGRLSNENDLYITGRKKDLIIRGGLNISPRRVEDVLEEHPAVRQAAVVGLPHDFWGEEVAAAVLPRDHSNWASVKAELLAHCKSRLNAASVPSRILPLTELPLSSTGKVRKDKLAELLQQEIREGAPS